VAQPVETNQLWFPFSIRAAQLVWRELFFTEGSYQPDPAHSPAWNRGAYLVEGLGHCGACHSPRDLLGGIEQGRQFTGAGVDGWFAPNLTGNRRLGLGRFTLDELANWLRMGEGTAPSPAPATGFTPGPLPSAVGPMAEVVHNSLRFLTPEDAQAMATYLLDLPASSTLVAGTVPAGRNPLGAQLYGEMCAACHGPAGAGMAGLAPRLAQNPVVAAPSPNTVLHMILGGQKPHHRMIAMPAFGRLLTDAQAAALASFVRAQWGNGAAGVSVDAVTAYRAKYVPAR
jgi:mono/diheme cytochrome c family protein